MDFQPFWTHLWTENSPPMTKRNQNDTTDPPTLHRHESDHKIILSFLSLLRMYLFLRRTVPKISLGGLVVSEPLLNALFDWNPRPWYPCIYVLQLLKLLNSFSWDPQFLDPCKRGIPTRIGLEHLKTHGSWLRVTAGQQWLPMMNDDYCWLSMANGLMICRCMSMLKVKNNLPSVNHHYV